MNNIESLINSLETSRQDAFRKLVELLAQHLPKGFEPIVKNETLEYVVPLSVFPQGYHCTPGQPLFFLSIASQKNFIAVYHMGLYLMPELLQWFQSAYPNFSNKKLDMGKSCIRFKKMDAIPYALLAQLFERVSVDEYLKVYLKVLNKE